MYERLFNLFYPFLPNHQTQILPQQFDEFPNFKFLDSISKNKPFAKISKNCQVYTLVRYPWVGKLFSNRPIVKYLAAILIDLEEVGGQGMSARHWLYQLFKLEKNHVKVKGRQAYVPWAYL